VGVDMTTVITPEVTFSGPIRGKAQKTVINLQKRRDKHFVQGNLKKAKQLQRRLYKSYSNTIASIYKVTCVNKGKKNVGWVERQRNPPEKNLLNTNIYTFMYNDER
jgi:hypothetical protein